MNAGNEGIGDQLRSDSPAVTCEVSGIPFSVTTLEGAATEVLGLADGRRGVPVRLMNAYCVALASEDDSYRSVVCGPGRNFPDGQPVAWLMRQLGFSNAEQVRGPSLFEHTIDRGQVRGTRHYFFGTTDETLALLLKQLSKRFPAMQVAGSRSAPFAPVDQIVTGQVVEDIRSTNPDLVWIGLGTPKQDFVGARLAADLGVPCLSVGAAFDFSAGTLQSSPEILRRFGMEWAYRLAKEPRRLFRRYAWGNTRFITLAARQLVSGRQSKR